MRRTTINTNKLNTEQQILLRAICERCHTAWLPNTKCNAGIKYQQSAHIFPHQHQTLPVSMRHPENCDGIPLFNTLCTSLYGYNKSFFSFPPLTLRGKFIFSHIQRTLYNTNDIKTVKNISHPSFLQIFSGALKRALCNVFSVNIPQHTFDLVIFTDDRSISIINI